jgi:hypothetical protein
VPGKALRHAGKIVAPLIHPLGTHIEHRLPCRQSRGAALISARKTDTRSTRSSAGHTHRPSRPRGSMSARKTDTRATKRHSWRSFVHWARTSSTASLGPTTPRPILAQSRGLAAFDTAAWHAHPMSIPAPQRARSAPHSRRQRTAPSHRHSTDRPWAPAPYPRIHPGAHATQPPPSMRIRTNA